MRAMSRAILLRLLAILFGLPSSTAASATIFNADDRQYVIPARGSAFSAIGLVARGLLIERYGTGTLIDECHVLTAQHVLGLEGSPIGARARFTGALGTADEVTSEGTVVAAGGREAYPAQSFEALARDWVLIRLDTCLGARLGFARLRTQPIEASELAHVESAGYPVGRHRRTGLTVDPSCEIRGLYALVWLNDCATLHGTSGGPIFRIIQSDGKPQLEIYAIQSAGGDERKAVPFSAASANQATPVWGILPAIQKYLSQSSNALSEGREAAPQRLAIAR